MNNKSITIPVMTLGKTLQSVLGLECFPLVSIKKVVFNNNTISILFQHDDVRYKYVKSPINTVLYKQVYKYNIVTYEKIKEINKDDNI